MKVFLLAFSLCFMWVSCNLKKDEVIEYVEEKVARDFPEDIQKMLDAHGGYERWLQAKLLKYNFKKKMDDKVGEVQYIALQNREVFIHGDGYDLGYDGNDYWVSPDLGSFSGSPRFYHNLYFYFHALPFLAADPGIFYTDKGIMKLDSQAYKAVSITYDEGVGDSPDDEYILLLDQETSQLQAILYTVTYYSQEKSKQYNAIKYSDWKDVEGLLLPSAFVGYKYNEGQLGEARYYAYFTDIELFNEIEDPEMFARPDISEVDTTVLND